MLGRGWVAAAAVAAGAAVGHGLDVAGLLPGVHESVAVRAAMGPAATCGWLLLAAGLGAVAARTRPVVVGAAASLLVSGVPELVGRHDPGAVFEPGAVAGALLQWALLMLVLALAVLIEHRLAAQPLAPVGLVVDGPRPAEAGRRPLRRRPVGPGRPRGPPRRPLVPMAPISRGQPCLQFRRDPAAG